MLLLALKVVLAPILVAAATVAHRRWGPAVGGRLVGLPLTAAPLLVLLSAAEGTRFTSHVAIADQAGDVAASAWCVVYAVASSRLRPVAAFGLAGAAFAACAFALSHLHTTVVTATALASVALLVALRWWPRPAAEGGRAVEPGNDLLLRMLVAAGFTFALSEAATSLGATTAGLVGALPLVTIVLSVATHRRQGAVATNAFLHGVMAGSFSVIAFLAVVAVALPALGALVAFPAALGAALAGQLAGGAFAPAGRAPRPAGAGAAGRR